MQMVCMRIISRGKSYPFSIQKKYYTLKAPRAISIPHIKIKGNYVSYKLGGFSAYWMASIGRRVLNHSGCSFT
jgi:hypothetical protein